MTTNTDIDLAGAEALINQACDQSTAAMNADVLRRLFRRVGNAVQHIGDVIVFVDGRVASLPATTTPGKIIELAGRDPAKFCVFRIDPCGGPPKPFKDGDRLEDGDKLAVSLCTPPADGTSREESLAQDLERLRHATGNPRVVRLVEGQDALLAEVKLIGSDTATVGVIVTPQYPIVGPDWFLLEELFTIDGFGGQKRGPFREGVRSLWEYSIHPPPGVVPSASDQMLNVVLSRLAQFRRVAA